MNEQILETWQINNRVNLMLLDAISEEGLHCTLSKRGGGTPAKQFKHLHNVRLIRIENYAGHLMDGQKKLSKDDFLNHAVLRRSLINSADAIARFIDESIQNGGAMKGFKRGVIPMLGYMISHESHHRGNIMLTLKQCGHGLPRDESYKIWAWNQI